MERRRRISAYGVCWDGDDRVLLVRLSALAYEPGYWVPPGGGLEHGESPARAAIREIFEETGLRTEITAIRDVVADVMRMSDRPGLLHLDRICYDVVVRGGSLRDEPNGITDLARWVSRDELADLPLLPFTAALVGLPGAPSPTVTVPASPSPPDLSGTSPPDPSGAEPSRGQRFAAYGVVTDPADRILLTRIAPGYPGAGKWHLPGGGTDFGEQPVAALLRELAEEADQVGVVTELLDVSHRHNPQAVGPEGYPIDWHTVRALYRVRVEVPTAPRVTEAAGGSTVDAAWFSREEARRLPLTEIAVRALEA